MIFNALGIGRRKLRCGQKLTLILSKRHRSKCKSKQKIIKCRQANDGQNQTQPKYWQKRSMRIAKVNLNKNKKIKSVLVPPGCSELSKLCQIQTKWWNGEQHEHDNDIENIWLNWKSIHVRETDRRTDGDDIVLSRVPGFKSHISSKVSADPASARGKVIGKRTASLHHRLSSNNQLLHNA